MPVLQGVQGTQYAAVVAHLQYRQRIVCGWDGVWLDWGWFGCFVLCGVDEIRSFILNSRH